MQQEKEQINRELIAITRQFLIESEEPYHREIRLNLSLQRHLGIDSLGRAELLHRIEKKFGVSFPDKILSEAESLEDIANYLNEAAPGQVLQFSEMTPHEERSTVDPSMLDTLQEVLLQYSSESPDKTHIYFQHENGQQEKITYQQLLNESQKVAHALRNEGLQENETVAIMLPTEPGFFYSFFGVLLAGGVPVPIYPPFRMHMLETYAKTEAQILRNAEVRFLITFEQAEKFSILLKAFVPSLKHVVTVSQLMKAEPLKQLFRGHANQAAFIQYTSGSTNNPKGVLLTHQNLLTNIRAWGKAIQVTPEDVAVSWLPLYHDMGLIGMWLGSLYYGIPLVLLTPFTFLNHPERWLWAIHYHRGTLSGAPNFAYELCVRKIEPALIEGLDLSSWRVAANGAEKVYPHTLKDFANKFADYGFKSTALLPVYGLAESTVGLAIPPINREVKLDHIDRLPFETEKFAKPSNAKDALTFVSCGNAIEGHEIRIVNDTNEMLGERHVGNLQFKGPSVMKGYYNNPEATAAIIHDGWVDSGDLAYQADGEVYITGRRKDLIIKAGRNIYPAELEEIIGNIPGIRQGCVIVFGLNDDKRATEQLIVVAETRETRSNAKNELVEKVKDVIAATTDIIPDHVVLVKPHTVPKTSSGKLQRAACKKMFLDKKLGKFHTPAWLQMVKFGLQWSLTKTLAAFSSLARLIYTIYVVLIFILTYIPLYIAVYLSEQPAAAKYAKLWARTILAAAFCPLRITGKEKLTKSTPVIYAANHASYMDAVVMLAILPVGVRMIGKKELLSTAFSKMFMHKLDFIAVDRLDTPKGLQDTQTIENMLKRGHSVMIFPEGTFSYSLGLRPFRLGAFKIATEANIPICPIALHGTRFIMRDGEKFLKPGKIKVTVSDLIYPKGQEWQDVTQLRNAVRMEIAKYCGEPSLDFIAAQTIAPSRPR